MNYRMIRATEQDGPEMLDIIESCPSKGLFELLYTRRPNPYLSYMAESKDTDIYVIKGRSGEIVLQGACTPHSVYINGQPKKLGYINGVRKHKDFSDKINWLEMINNAKTKIECDYHYCSILQANTHAQKVFEKKRPIIPDLNYICDYTTFIIKSKKKKIKDSPYTFRKADTADEAAIIDFLHEYGHNYDLFPHISKISEFYGLNTQDFYLLENDSKILCLCALWEQSSYKQYIVKKYNGILNLLSKIPDLPKLFGYIPLPKTDEVLRFPTLTFFTAKNNKKEYYKTMMLHIENVICKNYKMFLIGLAEDNEKFEIFAKRKNLRFTSRLYLIAPKNPPVLEKIHVECGML